VVVGDHLEWLHDVLITTPTNGQVLKYDSATSLWKNQTDLNSGVWGSITGTLSSQTDLQTALDGKYSTTNPSGFITSSALTGYATESFVTSQGYITSSALSPYLLSSTAASTYQTLSGMSSYLTTSAAASTYYPLTGNPSGFLTSAPVTSVAGRTGAVVLSNTDISGLGTMATATAADYSTTTAANALYYPLSGNPSSFLVAADISGKANIASPALTGNVTITSNTTGPALFIQQSGTGNILTLHDQAADTTFVAIDQNGKVNTVPAVTTGAGFNVPHGVAPTSGFVNGDIWSTTGGLFARITNATQQVAFQSWVVSQGYMTLSSALNAFSLKVAPVYQDFSQVAGVYDYHNGALINLFYNGGTDGRVAFYDGLPAGSKIQFYQDEQATQPITFNGAFNRENKLMTLGPKSQVTALKTFAGWLLYGDLQFPANGTLISEECAYWSGSDAVGTFWDGNYLHRITYADGSGGTYTSESLGGGTCYLPYGYCIESGVNISESTVSWSGCSSSGTATYSSSAGNIRADGYGGVYQETTGGYSAQYGDVIYDSYNGCVVKHDGMGGYFVEDNSGSGSYPSYGTYLGNVSGDLYIYYPDTGENFLAGSYSEDQYADGSGGVAYTENRYDSWYSYGTYLGYDYNFGQTIYADGYGSYYLS
jgi:hypothetical protein